MELSTYGYWIDRHATVIPVTQQEEHSGAAKRILVKADALLLSLGGISEKDPLATGWVRISVYPSDKLLYFEYRDYPTPQQMLALRRLSEEHGFALYDDVRQVVLEVIRPSWRSRHPAT